MGELKKKKKKSTEETDGEKKKKVCPYPMDKKNIGEFENIFRLKKNIGKERKEEKARKQRGIVIRRQHFKKTGQSIIKGGEK